MSGSPEQGTPQLADRLCEALARRITPEGLNIFYTYDALMTALNCREVIGERIYQAIVQDAQELLGAEIIEEAETIAATAWER